MADDLSLDTKREADATPEKALRRWLLEIKLAEKREKKGREKAKEVLDVYRGKDRKKNSFNMLWANTEVLRPALYNSPPKPDVRRRFRQDDALGKAVAEVAQRSLSYCADAYDLDNVLQADVLDGLLPGRAVARVRYVPKFKAVEGAQAEEDAGVTREEVEYEQALCEHVQWDDLLHGPGKVWEEVPWVAFRHRLTRDDLIAQFGEEIGGKITLNDIDDDDVNDARHGDDIKDVFKRAELWEIWDKDEKKVFFINESYRRGLIYPKDSPAGEAPIKFKNFYPIPRPLMLMEDTGNLIPEPLYEQYREQADEVNRLSTRINKIINACRVRFVYDSVVTELGKLMDAGDNEGVPTENARQWMQSGMDKAVWWMPVDQVAKVLQQLYLAREQAKQAVYEITGISDIIRGATDPNETLGAQQLKANSSSLRLQRMKAEVQRYARDLIRLLAEVIGEHFDVATLSQMTGLKFPTAQQKQVVQLKMQAIQQQAAAPGAQPPPQVQQQMQQAQQVLAMPTWEDIKAVLSNDMQREFRVDIETDSTVAQSLQQDMEGLREVIGGIVEFWAGVGPAVQAGAVSIEAVKAITLTIARRARMGLEVEDALESGLKQPPPQPQEQDNSHLVAAEKTKQTQITEQASIAREKEAEAASLQRDQLKTQEKVQLDSQAKAAEVEKHRIETEEKYAFERWKVVEEGKIKIQVADIQADAAVERADATAEGGEGQAKPKRRSKLKELAEGQGRTEESIAQLAQQVARYLEAQSAPVKIEKGADGRAAAVVKGGRRMPVTRNPDGSIMIGMMQ